MDQLLQKAHRYVKIFKFRPVSERGWSIYKIEKKICSFIFSSTSKLNNFYVSVIISYTNGSYNDEDKLLLNSLAVGGD